MGQDFNAAAAARTARALGLPESLIGWLITHDADADTWQSARNGWSKDQYWDSGAGMSWGMPRDQGSSPDQQSRDPVRETGGT